MKNEILKGEIVSQPSFITLNGLQTNIVVFVLIKMDSGYKKFFYRDSKPSDLLSNILVSSIGDRVGVCVSPTCYCGATKIKKFTNYTRGLGSLMLESIL